MSSIRRSSLISITLGLLTVIGAIFRSLRLNFGSYKTPGGEWGCFRIYPTSSVRRFRLRKV